MALTAVEIAYLLEEIAPALRGGWIQKIQQPTAHTLILDIRVPGHTHRLLISCRPETARLHVVRRPLPNPQTPPPFCRFLRAHVQGARIDDIHQMPHDRIVVIPLTAKGGQHTLVCELTGKKANIRMLDPDGRVLRSLVGQHDHINQPYAPPHRRDGGAHGSEPTRFAGAAGGDYPISADIETYYQDKESLLVTDAAKDARQRVLKKTLNKEQRRIEAWRGDLTKATRFQGYARYGELLKAHLGSIKTGMDHVTLVDYYDATLPHVTIPLDVTKSAHGNMDDYFKKHRKYLAAQRELPPRIERAERELEGLRLELASIENGTWTPPVLQLSADRAGLNTAHRPSRESGNGRQGPFRRFTSADGLPIFVGRNARENEDLTFGLARSDDLWLHARGAPGSHVVVRLEKGREPPPETIRDAATLALLYSDLKKSGKGDVIFTRRKWVKKAKGQAAGAVIVTQEKSLHVTLDKKRLDGLKARTALE